ncbi:MAG: hypothetical protein NTZ58_05420, partial [Solirubrobacterales bacterium]|nr:hypothetical protein [Solirubrobacterales bacterium]
MVRAFSVVLAVALFGLLPSSTLAAKATTWSGKSTMPRGHSAAGMRSQTLQLETRGSRIVAGELKLVMVCTDSASGATRSA